MKVKESVELTLSDGSQVNVSIFIFNGERHHKATVLTSGFLLLFLTDSTDGTEVSEGITATPAARKSSPETIWMSWNLLLERHTSVPRL